MKKLNFASGCTLKIWWKLRSTLPDHIFNDFFDFFEYQKTKLMIFSSKTVFFDDFRNFGCSKIIIIIVSDRDFETDQKIDVKKNPQNGQPKI